MVDLLPFITTNNKCCQAMLFPVVLVSVVSFLPCVHGDDVNMFKKIDQEDGPYILATVNIRYPFTFLI